MSVQYPWYGEFGNEFLPTLPTEKRPNPVAMIELPDKCTFLRIALGTAVLAASTMKATPLGKKFPLYSAAADWIALSLGTAKIWYCGF